MNNTTKFFAVIASSLLIAAGFASLATATHGKKSANAPAANAPEAMSEAVPQALSNAMPIAALKAAPKAMSKAHGHSHGSGHSHATEQGGSTLDKKSATALFGALAVADRIDLKYRIRANRK